MKKILVLENVDHLEQRFNDYLKKYHEFDELEKLFSIQSENKDILISKIFDQTFTDLMMESTFSDINQLLHLAGTLIKFKDKISFRRITVMYTYNKFDIFLNTLSRGDKVAEKLLSDLFDIYEVRAIEWEQFEGAKTTQYFKQLHHFYDVVKVEKFTFSDGTFMFEYQRSAYIDPRKRWRKNTLIPFNRKLVRSGTQFENFFNESRAMLEHQQELILSNPDFENHEEVKKSNEENLNILSLIESTFLLAKFDIEDEESRN